MHDKVIRYRCRGIVMVVVGGEGGSEGVAASVDKSTAKCGDMQKVGGVISLISASQCSPST